MTSSMQTFVGRNINLGVSGSLSAAGRKSPVLKLPLTFQTTDAVEIRLDHVVVRVTCAGELVGVAHLAGDVLVQQRHYVPQAIAEVPTSHVMIDFITDTFVSGSQTSLTVTPYGVITWRANQDSDPVQDTLPNNSAGHQLAVSRSDWYERVLVPLRQTDFVYLEIALPQGEAGKPWRSAAEQLRRAEAAHAAGDDDTVFGRLRGALDSFPGAKQHIFDAVQDPDKRAHVDALAKAFGSFLHLGRHVGEPGTVNAGQFPVTHADAAFAIAQMKTLLSYASQVTRPVD